MPQNSFSDECSIQNPLPNHGLSIQNKSEQTNIAGSAPCDSTKSATGSSDYSGTESAEGKRCLICLTGRVGETPAVTLRCCLKTARIRRQSSATDNNTNEYISQFKEVKSMTCCMLARNMRMVVPASPTNKSVRQAIFAFASRKRCYSKSCSDA